MKINNPFQGFFTGNNSSGDIPIFLLISEQISGGGICISLSHILTVLGLRPVSSAISSMNTKAGCFGRSSFFNVR